MKTRKDLTAREVADLHESLIRRLGDSSVPTLPEVAVRVVNLVSDPNATLRDFVKVVQTDQALTGRLLRTANSALFAQRQPVTQLQRAMVLLGLDRLKAMALGFHLSKASAEDDGDFSFKKMWGKSLFRAWAAFRLAEYFDRTITGEAFIVGLMQDAGAPMMPRLAGEAWARVVNPSDIPQKQHRCELDNLPFTHVDVIAALVKMWKLPDLLSFPIVNHHTSPEGMNPKDARSILHSVGWFVGTMHLESVEGEVPENISLAAARRLFGLESAEMKKMLRNAAADFRGSREMFAHLLDDTVNIEEILASANRELADSSVQEGAGGAATPAASGAGASGSSGLRCNGMRYEITASEGKRVTVCIADETGARLLSEEIDPLSTTEAEIRRRLMLEGAPADQARGGIEEILRRAA